MTRDERRHLRVEKLDFQYHDQPKGQIEECNLCGGHFFVEISQQDRYGYAAKACTCAKCGLTFLNPRMTAEAYEEFYEGVYRPLVSAYHGRKIDARSIQNEQKDYAIARADFIASNINRSGGKLLDVGGSTGVVAEHFVKRFGFHGVVLDPSAEELQEAIQKGLETKRGLIESVSFSGRKFQLVLLCQTVDHLLDIRSTLRKIRDCLATDGLFFVDIVDFRAGYLRNWSIEETIKIDHPFYLTQSTMEAFLNRSGLKIIRKSYASDHLHIGYLCRKSAIESESMPDSRTVVKLFDEIRLVQNAPSGAIP